MGGQKRKASEKKGISFTEYIAEVAHAGDHKWPEVIDFCIDAINDPQWEEVTSVASMKKKIHEHGWGITDNEYCPVGEAAMNTWYAFKGLKRTSERKH